MKLQQNDPTDMTKSLPRELPLLIDQLVDHALNTRFESFDHEVVEAARMRLVDTLGCTIGGANASGNLAFLDLIRSWGGTSQATILSHGDRVPLQYAAMMNSLMARSFDFEVAGPEPEGVNAGKMVGHVCSTTEPTALSVAEFTGASGKELLAAVILGGDIGARMAVADEFNFDQSFEVCGTANAFGATALVGRLMGLNHQQLVNAFGILLNLMAGSFQSLWDGVHTFKLPGAMAAFNAVLAVQLSLRGFTGAKDPLTSQQGYFALYGNNPKPENALADLGRVYYVKGMHKLHPSCYGNHNPIESALEIVRSHAFDLADVESVTLEVPPNRIKHFLNQNVEADDCQPRSLFSIPYGVANVLMRKEVRIEHYTDEYTRVPALLDLVRKVRLVPNLPLGKNHAGKLTVILKNGQSLSAYRESPLGWKDNPVTAGQVWDKYWRNIDFSATVSRENAATALGMLERLEEVRDVASLASCLVRAG
ncbi:MmgE/PrpD family protein [Cupriavidus basilensis]|uniref:MmgE/PrpD family protein n=1 Tax=Cupriavidus basilensis TaxID=68895 RepID=UPI00157B589D|nr:MmgE/PrpD family protein [Cupriavidus basilensis]NUA26927.1 MmgE/PrpD family protein [Cupriavidus basilensis]